MFVQFSIKAFSYVQHDYCFNVTYISSKNGCRKKVYNKISYERRKEKMTQTTIGEVSSQITTHMTNMSTGHKTLMNITNATHMSV